MNLQARIARMERREAEIAPPCPVCRGYLFLLLIPDANGKADMQQRDRLRATDDHRCRGCGRAAQVMALRTPMTGKQYQGGDKSWELPESDDAPDQWRNGP